MELLGTIKSIGDLETIKQLKKKTVLVETQSKFPQTIPVEFLNDKIDLVNDLKVGQTINLGINLRSNEYKGKYYINVTGWKVISAVAETTSNAQMPDVNDNLPF
jgi:hypothetical protein